MGIIRKSRPEGNFYILDKSISEDRRLSWAARGVLIFLLGKPDNWRVSVQNLINETQEADPHSRRDAVYKLLKELERVGYVQKVQSNSSDGTFDSVDYLVGETSSPLTEIPEPAPLTALPLTAEPLTANPTLTSTEDSSSTKKAASIERASRLPPDWWPSVEEQNFARAKRPDLDVKEVAHGFRDYWHAVAGPKGKKLDWSATWRNWIRNQKEKRSNYYDDSQRTIDELTGRRGRGDGARTWDV